MLKNAPRIIARRHVRIINKIRLAGTVISANTTNRQILMETKTLTANNHRNLRTAANYKTEEYIFVNLLDESVNVPRAGDRVTVDGLLKRVNFCDSSLVNSGEVPIMERSLSRLEVYTKDLTLGAERDINHVVLGGYVKSIYENVDGMFGSNGLIKMTFNKGPMMFVGDGIMTSSPERFPHGNECYHQYMANREQLVYRIRRNRKNQGHLKKGLRANNSQYIDNFAVIATGSVGNVVSIQDQLDKNEDPIFQSRVFCFSLTPIKDLKTKLDSSCQQLYTSNFLRDDEKLVFPDYDDKYRKYKLGDEKEDDDVSITVFWSFCIY